VGGVWSCGRGTLSHSDAVIASRYIRVKKFAELTGYSEKAVYHKIERGIWRQGREYQRAPDGNICIDIEGYYRWVEGDRGPVSRR